MNEQLALALIYEDYTVEAALWEPVTEDEMYDQDRWTTSFSRVYRKKGTDEYYNIWWTEGSTEYQDVELEWNFNYGAYRVYPYTKVITAYSEKPTQ